MSVYKTFDIKNVLEENEYPGRGIIVGKTCDGKNAVAAYFIMGRSQNSQNRIFVQKDDDVTIYPFDESKVEDPSLIIYSPIRVFGNKTIVTNGDQTDTIYEFLSEDKSFEQALNTRCFEPDAPNFTPRISALLCFENNDFSYKMSILKSGDDKGGVCNRYTFDYTPINGLCHFIHTYNGNGAPIPSFTGEPERINAVNDIDDFTNTIWESLNPDNKVSLFVRFIDLKTHETQNRLINKNK